MSQTKLGFVRIPVSEVIDLAAIELGRIRIDREKRAEEFVQQFMTPRTGIAKLFFGAAPRTREEALEIINGDTWLRHEYWYLSPYFISDKQAGLQKIINVGNNMMSRSGQVMELTIEAAGWLYPKE